MSDARALRALTESNNGEKLAFVIGDIVQSTTTIRAPIADGAKITGFDSRSTEIDKASELRELLVATKRLDDADPEVCEVDPKGHLKEMTCER